jgi:hypothetical protein
MSTEAITLELDADAVRAFKSASGEEQERIKTLIGAWLLAYARADASSLKETMDDVSRKAAERGLTPEILQSILEGD